MGVIRIEVAHKLERLANFFFCFRRRADHEISERIDSSIFGHFKDFPRFFRGYSFSEHFHDAVGTRLNAVVNPFAMRRLHVL